MKFIAIIPARYASTRFPGKPLAMLGGKTVIQRVYEQAIAVLGEAYVATDDERIYKAVEAFGGKVVMTRTDHKSGTDRIQEAATKINTDADVIINVQGDEPFIQASQIETLMHLFDDPTTQIGTLGKHFETMEAVENPSRLCTLLQSFGHSLHQRQGVQRVVWRVSILETFRHLCLSPRGIGRGNKIAPKQSGKSREPGAITLVTERLPHSRGFDQYRNGRHRHARRLTTR